MKTFFRHLRRHTLTMIIVVFFLFIQAMCDLRLPDYTSKIVDVGISQNGIESNVPEKILKEDLNKLLIFMNEEDAYTVKEKYELKGNIYILKEPTQEEQEKLSKILIDPELAVLMIEMKDKELLNKINSKEDLFNLASTMNLEGQSSVAQYMNIDEKLKMQYGINYVKNEYKKLNIDISKTQNNFIKKTGAKMLSLALLGAIIAAITSYLTSRLSAKFGKTLREEVVQKIMKFGNKEFKEISLASLITRSTNDINRVQMFITMLLRIMIFAPIMGIGALLKVINNEMNFIIILAVSIILVLVVLLFIIAMPKFKLVQELIDKINLVFREILNGLPVIRSFKNEKNEEERFDEVNKKLTKVNLFVDRIMILMMPTMTFLMNAICILIIYVGAKKIDMGTIQIGTLMAFIQYTIQIIMSFLLISVISIMIPRAWISIKRIAEIFDKDIEIEEPEVVSDIGNKFKGTVEFKEVYFRYHDADEDILENISFKATPGTTTAIIGGTGSGKSTLINLIPRFFDVTGGQILIDGIDVKNLSLYDIRENIGYVPQKGVLFTGTIEENISFGKEKINKKQLELASKISQSEEFINEKPKKYKEEISQGGTNVSGGQKQRLSIARAIYKNPSIYIFDDSFSALDFKTDKNLRKELKKATKESTVIIVAQRISTVLNADQIIVLDEGKIVGIGSHEELMSTCDIYKEIALSQVTEEELNEK